MNPIISIIIPVYNVEKYLRKCVESVIAQTFTDIEIILVDDGSTDNSGIICDEYSQLDERVRVIHKENGGLSSARNAGIDIAKGEYLGFVDSDDWIEPDMYELLYKNIVNYNADISACRFCKVSSYDSIEFTTDVIENTIVYNKEQALESMLSTNGLAYNAWNKLYRKSLFDGVRYPNGMLMEDKATTYKLIHKSKYVVLNFSKKYHYFLRENSILRSNFNPKYLCALDIHEELILFIKHNYPNLNNNILSRYAITSIKILVQMIKSNYYNEQYYNRCISIIKSNAKYCFNVKDISIKIKAVVLIAYICPWIFKLAYKTKLLIKNKK